MGSLHMLPSVLGFKVALPFAAIFSLGHIVVAHTAHPIERLIGIFLCAVTADYRACTAAVGVKLDDCVVHDLLLIGPIARAVGY